MSKRPEAVERTRKAILEFFKIHAAYAYSAFDVECFHRHIDSEVVQKALTSLCHTKELRSRPCMRTEKVSISSKPRLYELNI
jgi:hypothetical protein